MLTDVACGLAARGERTAVIASRQLYDDPGRNLPAREVVHFVEVHRVWTTRFGRTLLGGRAVDYLTFYLSAAWTLFRIARRGDIVVIKTDPPMLAGFIGPIARLKGAKLVNWLQDIFPEVAQVLGLGKGTGGAILFHGLRAVRNWSLKSAAANVVLGRHMAARVANLGAPRDRIHIIPNFADGRNVRPCRHNDNAIRREWSLEGKFVVGYSGNLGRAHEYETLLEAIALLERDTSLPYDIKWLFIGGGALHDVFREKVGQRQLRSVVFKPYQPRDRLSESLSAADVHLVSLRSELEGLIVPSKFYGIAAVGRPTISIGATDGEISKLLTTYDCGIPVPEGDGAMLAQVIAGLSREPDRVEAMGRRARQAFDRDFDLEIAIRRWQDLLATVRDGHVSSSDHLT